MREAAGSNPVMLTIGEERGLIALSFREREVMGLNPISPTILTECSSAWFRAYGLEP